MALSRFPKSMADNVDAVLGVAGVIRHVISSSGDLSFRNLDQLQSGLEVAKTTFIQALTEGQKAPAAAESFMASVNGPASLAEYQEKAIAIETAASAWNAVLSETLNRMSTTDLIALVTRPDSQTRHIERASFIPATIADPLRKSVELAALLTAFESAGA